MKIAWKIFQACVSLGLMAYLLWRAWGDLDNIRLASGAYLAGALAFVGLGVLFSAGLWRACLPSNQRLPFTQLLAHYLLGMFWNNFLPTAFGGDAVRVAALQKSSGGLGRAVNSVLMARLLSLWSMLIFAAAALSFWGLRLGWKASLPLAIGGLALFGLLALGSAFLLGAPLKWVVSHFPARWQTWQAQLQAYRRQPRTLLAALIWAGAIQASAVGVNYCTAHALGISLRLADAWMCVPVIALLALFPVSLGGWGVREGAYILILSQIGFGKAQALALSVTVALLLTLVSLTGALVVFRRPAGEHAYLNQ